MYKVFIKDKPLKVEKNEWAEFQSHYKLIEAAGGVVKNAKGEILFIYRLGKWDLPKGKIESREDKETAAIREVEEECNVNKLRITKELSPTYHTYELKGKSILKRTFWFEMNTSSLQELIPQTEEHIEQVKWIDPAHMEEQLGNTYASILEVLKEQKS